MNRSRKKALMDRAEDVLGHRVDTLTVKEFCRLTRRDSDTVYRWLRSGELSEELTAQHEEGTTWLIPIELLDRVPGRAWTYAA